MKKFSTRAFIKDLNKNEFIKVCGVPLESKAFYPTIGTKDGKVFITVPFAKTKTVNEKTKGIKGVFPFDTLVTFKLNCVTKAIPGFEDKIELGYVSATPVKFEALYYSKSYEKVDFKKPIDVFPHKALVEIGQDEYKQKVEKIYDAYDLVINDLLGIEKSAGIDKVEFKQLIDVLVAPRVKLLYKLVDEDFYKNYLA